MILFIVCLEEKFSPVWAGKAVLSLTLHMKVREKVSTNCEGKDSLEIFAAFAASQLLIGKTFDLIKTKL